MQSAIRQYLYRSTTTSFRRFWVNDHIGVGVLYMTIPTRDHYLWETSYIERPVTLMIHYVGFPPCSYWADCCCHVKLYYVVAKPCILLFPNLRALRSCSCGLPRAVALYALHDPSFAEGHSLELVKRVSVELERRLAFHF